MIIIGAALSILWGTAHLFPTKGVVRDFGDISKDNQRVLTMEWIGEGMTLIFIGVLLILTTIFTCEPGKLNLVVNISSASMLVAMAVLSLFTGFRVKFIVYKLCPVIFLSAAALILTGTFLW